MYTVLCAIPCKHARVEIIRLPLPRPTDDDIGSEEFALRVQVGTAPASLLYFNTKDDGVSEELEDVLSCRSGKAVDAVINDISWYGEE